MRYFTYIAEQSFKSDDEGRKLFYIGGPFSRPYVVPDSSTETRLYLKMTWYLRICLPIIILSQSFLWPVYYMRPWVFVVFLASAIVLPWILLRLIFRSDLRSLERRPTRISLRRFYTSVAERHSKLDLAMGLFGSIGFVAFGILISFVGGWMRVCGLLAVIFFGPCSVGWGYALYLKRTTAMRSL